MISTYKEYLEIALYDNQTEKIGCNNKDSFFIALTLFFTYSHFQVYWFIENEQLMDDITDECLEAIGNYLKYNGKLSIYVNKNHTKPGKLREFLKEHNCENLQMFKYGSSLHSKKGNICDFIIFDDKHTIIHYDPYEFLGTICLNDTQTANELKKITKGKE